jgi:hypothetical protein
MESHTLENFGYVSASLPDELFLSIQQECKQAQSLNQEMISGLSGKGVPKHYWLDKSQEHLNKFLIKILNEFNWNFPNLYNIKLLTKDLPFAFGKSWINFQQQGEFVPNHTHDGLYSYTIWINIPYDKSDNKHAGNFEFTYNDIIGNLKQHTIKLSRHDEGKIILFPSRLPHIVYPFYNSDQTRISVSGNILLDAK